jgi:hypothetical protein
MNARAALLAGLLGLNLASMPALALVIDLNMQADIPNLSALIGNVGLVFPGIITLIVNIIPLYIVQGLIYLIIGIMAGLVARFAGGWGK